MKKTKKKKRGPQNRGQKTRKKLLDTTVKCLLSTGSQSLRYSQIAKQAKVPQALMGYHFPNLEALLLEVVQSYLVLLKDRSVENVEMYSSSPKQALAAYIMAPFEVAEESPEFRAVWSCFYHLATVNKDFKALNNNIRKTGRDRIVNLVTMVMATESMGSQLSTPESIFEMATSIQAIITGLAFTACVTEGEEYEELGELAVKTCFDLMGIE